MSPAAKSRIFNENEIDASYFSYIKDLVINAPKLPLDHESVIEYTALQESGKNPLVPDFQPYNNFFLLFAAEDIETTFTGDRSEDPALNILDTARSHDKWEQFRTTFGPDIEFVKGVLQDKNKTYGVISSVHYDLFRARNYSLAQQLEDLCNHPFGLDAIRLYYNNLTKPVLIQLWNSMLELGFEEDWMFRLVR